MITNGLGQFILIYGTRLFCIVNPIILFAGFIGIVNIIQMLYPLSKKAKCIVILLISALVLSIDQLKYLVYWVVGYTNYCLIFTVLIFYIYHYLKYGLKKNYILNLGSMLLLCIAHESIFVFFIIFILGNMIKNILRLEKLVENILVIFLY